MSNLGYGALIVIFLAMAAALVTYVSSRQEECEKIGATLVRKPLGVGWVCVKAVAPHGP